MFGKLKEKLKGWFTKSKEKVEETAETVEKPVEEKPEKPKKEKKPKEKPKVEKKPTKVEKTEEKIKEVQEKVEEIQEKVEDIKPELEKTPETVEEAKEEIKEVQEKVEEIQEAQERADELIEEAKEKDIPEPPLAFETGKMKLEPDLEKLKRQEEEIPTPEKKSFFQKIKSSITYKITKEEFDEIFDDLEMLLLENNVALEVVEDIKKILSEKLIGKEIKKQDLEQEIRNELKSTLNEILIEPDNPLELIKEKQGPFVILVFGINGVGKTTAIAKLTHFLKKTDHTVVLAAGDTFRAASIEQIQEHADKLKVPLIKQDYKSDPAAVGFDAIKYAEKHKIDAVIIDTAGRMHTKSDLIQEMEKISRVTKPDLKLFVAESIAGNDATEQARTFHEALNIDGSILTKADIDEKGGTIISVSHITNKPIFFLGTGQGYEDLQLFNKQKFIKDLGL